MHVKSWASNLHASQAENLSLITSCVLGVVLMSVFSDIYRAGVDQPGWFVLLDIFLITVMSLVVALVYFKKYPAHFVNFIALFSMLCIGGKVVAVTFVTSNIRPLEMALVCMACSLCFLSYRFVSVALFVFTAGWLLAASLQLSFVRLLFSFVILMASNTFCILILGRRVRARIHVYELEERVETFLSMCASCKKTRDAQGNWISIEAYITNQQKDTQVSHGICPACSAELMRELPSYNPGNTSQ